MNGQTHKFIVGKLGRGKKTTHLEELAFGNNSTPEISYDRSVDLKPMNSKKEQ